MTRDSGSGLGARGSGLGARKAGGRQRQRWQIQVGSVASDTASFPSPEPRLPAVARSAKAGAPNPDEKLPPPCNRRTQVRV